MKTVVLIEIDHKKPFPEGKLPITDALAQRAYMYLYSVGVEVGVKAKLIDSAFDKEPWEKP